MRGHDMNEIWLSPSGFDGRYEVSSMGRVRSLLSARGRPWSKGPVVLKARLHIGGYSRVLLRRTDFYVHRLVAEAFIGPCPDGFQCAHLDGDPSNNAVTNLQWVSPLENQRHRVLHGTNLARDAHPMAKLTSDDVRCIRLSKGVSQGEIARRYGVSQASVSMIVTGKTWGQK